MEHRWGDRIQLNLPVQLDFGAGSLIWGRIVNVSLSGAFVMTRERVPSQPRIEIQFEPAGSRNPKVLVLAYVVRRTKHGVGFEWHAFAAPEIAATVRREPASLPLPRSHVHNAGKVACGAERSGFGFLSARQHIRAGAHRAPDQDWLARVAQGLGDIRMARTEGTRRPFAVNVELLHLAVRAVLLDFARVVRDVVEQRQLRLRQNVGKDLAHEVREDLAIGERAIDRGTHCTQVLLADGRVDRSARQLSVWEADRVLTGGDRHPLEKLSADLMTQTPRPAVDHLAWRTRLSRCPEASRR